MNPDLFHHPLTTNLDGIDPFVDSKFSYNLFELLSAAARDAVLADVRVFKSPDSRLWIGRRVGADVFLARQLEVVLSDGEDSKIFCVPACGCQPIPNFWRDYTAQGRNAWAYGASPQARA